MKKIIRTVLLLSVVMVLCCLFCANAASAEITNEGECGKSLTWTLDTDGVLTVSGTGAMTSFTSAGAQPWYFFSEQITSVVIEDGVTSGAD